MSLKSQYPCPSAAIVASWSRNAHGPVEPGIPGTGKPGEDPILDGVHVRPSVTHDAVIEGSGPTDCGVLLPASLVEDARNKFEEAFDSFDHISLRRKLMLPAEDSRSDVTNQILSKAAAAWPDMDDDSSSSEV